MSHQPVAWRLPNMSIKGEWVYRDLDEPFIGISGENVGEPLYTAPRELSDDEIIEVGNAVVNLIDSNEGWIEFARAILKKANT